jgi:hypothetical protein
MRAFICDPVCALPFGHNAVALNLFGQAMRAHFDKVTTLCCRHLPETLVKKNGFQPFYEFYYHDFMQLPTIARLTVQSVTEHQKFADELEAQATTDARRLLDAYKIGAQDAIIFPSLDFYGGIGLVNALASRPADQQPRLLLRFIGVMETASKFYRDPMMELAGRLTEARDLGMRMSLSAETPKLANWLAELLDLDVSTTPYPDVHEPLPMPMLGSFNVYCPGSARPDKGFLELHQVFTELRQRDRDLSVRFTTQSLNARDAQHQQNYISRLYALPGLELLPSAISDELMLQQFRQCCVVLLPYDREIYAKRGSAAMMEAVCFGRPIVTLSGTAFAEQVLWYRLGIVVDSVSQMADAVLALAGEPRERLERRALRGRAKFLADVASAYKEWLTAAP